MLHFPDGDGPPPYPADIARRDPSVREFLQAVGKLAEPGFDLERPGTLDAFNKMAATRLVLDVRV